MSVRPYRKERHLIDGDFTEWGEAASANAVQHFNNMVRADSTNFIDQIEYAVIAGSWLFGLAHTESDMDIKGFHISPLKKVLSINGANTTIGRGGTIVNMAKEQVEFHEIEKFINGCIANNPTILEVLFANLEFVLIMGDAAKLLRENATRFLVPERIFQAFSNYAIDQINHMKSKLWVVFSEEEKTKADKVLQTYDFNSLDLNKIGFGFHDLSSDKLKREKVKRIANFEAAYELYPDYFDGRYDTKHAAHSLRLLMSGYHCLKYGEFVTMPSVDGVAYLREIRKGNISLVDFFSYTNNMFAEIIAARQNPAWEREEPDYEFINDILYTVRMRNR